MAAIFLLSGGKSMVPLSLQLISYFWALLTKVLWALAHPGRENHRLFVHISSFQEQKSLWGFINSLATPGDPSSFLLSRGRTLLSGRFPAPRRCSQSPAAQTLCSPMPD